MKRDSYTWDCCTQRSLASALPTVYVGLSIQRQRYIAPIEWRNLLRTRFAMYLPCGRVHMARQISALIHCTRYRRWLAKWTLLSLSLSLLYHAQFLPLPKARRVPLHQRPLRARRTSRFGHRPTHSRSSHIGLFSATLFQFRASLRFISLPLPHRRANSLLDASPRKVSSTRRASFLISRLLPSFPIYPTSLLFIVSSFGNVSHTSDRRTMVGERFLNDPAAREDGAAGKQRILD